MMDMELPGETKRQVPTMLKKILNFDVQLTKKFVELALKTTALKSLRQHAKFLEVSCHGIVWFAAWLTFTWLFDNSDLYQLQINMIFALILDIVIIAVLKAFVRRRRPVPMNKLTAIGPDKYSFPSGHASRAAMVAMIVINMSSLPMIFFPPLLAWVAAVSISRVLLERHYILDVACGIGIGVLESLVVILLWLSQSSASYIRASLSGEREVQLSE